MHSAAGGGRAEGLLVSVASATICQARCVNMASREQVEEVHLEATVSPAGISPWCHRGTERWLSQRAGVKHQERGFEVTHRMRSLSRVLAALDATLHFEHRPDLGPLVSWNGGSDIPIHRWFRYREAYSPTLVGELGLGKTILDPFCGCGSIMVGAAESGRLSVGIDINPLAVFVAQVKFRPLSPSQVREVKRFREDFRKSAADAEPWPLPALRIANKVFEGDIVDAILRLRTAIESTRSSDGRVRDFLLLAWLAILEDVGSFYKEGNGIKYRNVKRTKSGYVRLPEGRWQRERFGYDQEGFAFDRYETQLSMMILDAAKWEKGAWEAQQVRQGNALEMTKTLRNQSFDSIIFSPPYANRFDYFEAFKVELWFGGFVHSYRDMSLLRKRSLRSHLGADLTRPATEIKAVEELIHQMDRNSSSWRMGVVSALRGYFDDMYNVLVHCRSLLTEGGRCYVVAGNSAFAGVIFPTDSLIAHLGLKAGFCSAQLMQARHLTVAPQQRNVLRGLEQYMRETVVVLA